MKRATNIGKKVSKISQVTPIPGALSMRILKWLKLNYKGLSCNNGSGHMDKGQLWNPGSCRPGSLQHVRINSTSSYRASELTSGHHWKSAEIYFAPSKTQKYYRRGKRMHLLDRWLLCSWSHKRSGYLHKTLTKLSTSAFQHGWERN